MKNINTKPTHNGKFSSSSVTLVIAFALVFAFNTFSQPDGINAENSYTKQYSAYDLSAGINAFDLIAEDRMILSTEYKVAMGADGLSYIMYETENKQTSSRTEYLGELYAPKIVVREIEFQEDQLKQYNDNLQNTANDNPYLGFISDGGIKGKDNGTTDGDKKEAKNEKKAKKSKSRIDGKYLGRYSCIDDYQFDQFEKENPTRSFGNNFTNKKNSAKTTGQVTRRINAKYLLEHASIESFLADEYETK
ncbi:MAG: hypothetical protein WCM76_06950 [Bacteroidota bacterium]